MNRYNISTGIRQGKIGIEYTVSDEGKWVEYTKFKEAHNAASLLRDRVTKLETELKEVKRSNGRCKKTLGYYGSRTNWEYPYMFKHHDGGAKARETLKEAK